MAIEPKDYRVMVRVSDDLRGLLQSMADKEKTSVAEIVRQAVVYYFDEGDRIDRYRSQIKGLEEQNSTLLSTYTSLLQGAQIDRGNFNACVTTLMDVLEGKVSEDEKQQLAAQFAPYAELARRQQEEAKRQYEEPEAKAAARKKNSVDE